MKNLQDFEGLEDRYKDAEEENNIQGQETAVLKQELHNVNGKMSSLKQNCWLNKTV